VYYLLINITFNLLYLCSYCSSSSNYSRSCIQHYIKQKLRCPEIACYIATTTTTTDPHTHIIIVQDNDDDDDDND